MMGDVFNEADVLAFDMFEGDETDVRVLSDKFVTTRADHRCVVCRGDISAGSRVRARTERNNEDRKVMTFYACRPCCEAMAIASGPDAGRAIEERTAIGMRRGRDEAREGF